MYGSHVMEGLCQDDAPLFYVIFPASPFTLVAAEYRCEMKPFSQALASLRSETFFVLIAFNKHIVLYMHPEHL